MEHPSGKQNDKNVRSGFYEWATKRKTISLMKKNHPKIQELLDENEDIIGYSSGYTTSTNIARQSQNYHYHLFCFTDKRIFFVPYYLMLKELWKGNKIIPFNYDNIQTSIRKVFFIKKRPCLRIQTDEFPDFVVDLGWNDYEIITELVNEKCNK